jgi:uncharacterized protein YdbL (DUF1318 family)
MNHRKLFVAVAAVAALGVAAGAAVAQTASQKALVDQAKAAGAVGEQADGYLGVRTSVAPETQAAVSATNAGRRQAYARSAADAGTTAEVAGTRMFETQLMPRISTGQWYKNAAGQWVQR